MDENTKKHIKKQLFGQRYSSAHLGRIALGERESKKLHSWLTSEKSICFINGGPGTGKTYFAAGIYDELLEKYKGAIGLSYYTEARFYADVRSAHDGEYYQSIQSMAEPIFVIYDDLGSCGITDWRRETFYTFLDIRYSTEKPTLLISNLTEQEIHVMFGSRVHSRIFSKDNVIISFNDLPDQRI